MEARVFQFMLHQHKGTRLRKNKWDIKQRLEWGQGGAADTGLSRGGGPLHSESAPPPAPPIITVKFSVYSVTITLHRLAQKVLIKH